MSGRSNQLRAGLIGLAALAALTGIAPAAAAMPPEAGSLNGDGAPDLLVGEPDGGLRGYVSDPAQASTEGGPLIETQPLGQRAADWRWYGHGDFDGDGVADVALVTRSGELRIAKTSVSDGQVSVGKFVTAAYGFSGQDRIIAGDLDGDGREDMLARKAGTNTTNVYRNNGAPIGLDMFEPAEPVLTTAPGVTLQRLADVTGDGRLDVLSIRDDGELHLRDLSNGASHLIGRGWAGFSDIAVGDYQDDGRPDLLTVDSAGQAEFHLMDKPFDPAEPFGVFTGNGYVGDGYNAPYWQQRRVFD